jgi:glycosyltransferase involved in cell wall biosynthesis
MQRRIRLCVNGMADNSQIRGPVRYIYELVRRIDRRCFDVTLIAGIWQKEVYCELESNIRILYFDVNRGKWARALFFVFGIPRILKEQSIDVYHVPDTKPLPLFFSGVKVVSTIHDAAEFVVPFRFGRLQSLYRSVVERIQARRSNGLITVSYSSRADLVKYLGLRAERIEVIHIGATPLETDDVATGPKFRHPGILSVLYVGVLENGKNVDRLVAAFGSLPPDIRNRSRLYLAGRKGNAFPAICEIVERFGIQSQVEMLGYVDDQTLAALYRDTSVFAYVSEYEGFGLPVVEAMLRGLPVLTSNRSSLPEVAGSAALIVKTDVESICAGLARLLTDESLRSELSRKGPARAAEFDWAKTARKTEEVYRKVLGLAVAGSGSGAKLEIPSDVPSGAGLP